MTSTINEWEFTGDVVSWLNEALARDPSLPFSRAKTEQRGEKSQKRRDVTLLDKNNVIVLTGEIKLPFQKDGSSPYIESVVQDARKKAQRANSPFFFTWNINEFVLWETFPPETGQKDRKYNSWEITKIFKSSHMEAPSFTFTIQQQLAVFLHRFADIFRGVVVLGDRSPDEKFIDLLESALKIPILHTLDELEKHYAQPLLKTKLDQWMRDQQGWTIYDDPEGIRDNLERAAKFTCYALVNKLVFHEALLKRYTLKIQKLAVPEHIETGDNLRQHLDSFFDEAKRITGDYETVFGEEPFGIGNRIPFYSDKIAPHWRVLIDQIHQFDFSRLDYEVIGAIFERLISPDERRKYGQFYTRPEVVDLINSFCIRTGWESVMDPACGGGTFLVRAYARKRELSPSRKHDDLLADLFGVDISHFAAHLTTINLATRNLSDSENYPQIARNDFFDVAPLKTFLQLPRHMESKGMGAIQHRQVAIPLLDAVVGNPPYIRQEEIRKDRKAVYQKLIQDESKANLSARSDIHCYFWPHAYTFLKDDGYLCFLTSSQWLDVEYGFRLQKWILKNFEIVAIFESLEEPWFVGARVATAVTILRRQQDEAARAANMVRFAQIRRPIREILFHDGTTAGAMAAANDFRDEILGLNENTSNMRYRLRLVKQDDLWNEGVKLSALLRPSKDSGSEVHDFQDGDYLGGKWGVHLRAPDVWFALLEGYGDRLRPFGELAEIRFGVKSGKDSFFYPIDVSGDCLRKEKTFDAFMRRYGVERSLVDSGQVKLLRCGDGRGEVRPIESKYLEPEVHSLMEIDGYTVSPENCSRMILLAGMKKQDIRDRFLREYIQWGEAQGYHTGSTCAARASKDREWYDLTGHKRGALFWPKSQQYKHAAPLNENGLLANCNLYDIHLDQNTEKLLLAGILNSSLVVLSKYQYGRPVGVEGNLKTEVVDVNMMLIPDPSKGSLRARKRIVAAFEAMKKRKALPFLSERRLREMAYTQKNKVFELRQLSDVSELDMPDRQELDDAVLELIGVTPKAKRQEILFSLHKHLKELFQFTRSREEAAIANKKQTARRGQAKPYDIAFKIFQEIKDGHGRYLQHYSWDFLNRDKLFDTVEIPPDGDPRRYEDLYTPHGVEFVKSKKRVSLVKTKIPDQVDLIILIVNSGLRGLIRLPHEPEECSSVFARYGSFVNERDSKIWEMIQERTADEDLRNKIYAALMPMILNANFPSGN